MRWVALFYTTENNYYMAFHYLAKKFIYLSKVSKTLGICKKNRTFKLKDIYTSEAATLRCS